MSANDGIETLDTVARSVASQGSPLFPDYPSTLAQPIARDHMAGMIAATRMLDGHSTSPV